MDPGTERERIAKIEMRLENGQKEFVAQREDVRALRAALEQQARDLAPKPMSRLQVFAFIVGPVLGLVILIGGFVWQAARYPDRSEFDEARATAVDAARSTERKLFALEGAQALQARDISATVTALEKIDAKLDRLLVVKGK